MSTLENNNVLSGALEERDLKKIREAVCVQVEKVYDSCSEKDCIEDAKVLFLSPSVVNNAINVKVRKAEVVDVVSDIEPVPFKRGFYTVDMKFFICVTLDVLTRNGYIEPSPTGLVLFDKKVILFGSEGEVKIFKSHFVEGESDTQEYSTLQQDNLPIAKVEVAEPLALNARIQSIEDKLFDDVLKVKIENLPKKVSKRLSSRGELESDEERHQSGSLVLPQRIVVTLGLFSIIKLVRFVQLRVPSFGFCVPFKECVASTDENPCELFEEIEFPVDEFFPPQICEFPGALGTEMHFRDNN